jgi:predicted nucleotide-binding protein (sugar kinase/HSP70/actin superfamily)
MAPDFDPKKAAFFMPAASGPCRFGQYNRLHRLILDELGLQNVPILVFDQTGGYHNDMANMGSNFQINAWRSFVILDSMQKIVLERRPYEVNKGDTDAVYKEWLDRLIKNVGKDAATLKALALGARRALTAVKIDTSSPKPRIGIVGEIFVRSNQFANDGLIRKLEAIGGQCGIPPIEEWLDYIDHQRKRRNRLHLEGGYRDCMKQAIKDLQGFHIHVLAGKAVLGPGNDQRRREGRGI